MFPAEEVRFRPAAYGLYVRDGLILLGRSRFTGKWDIPGGGVESWETLEQGLVREFEEETGVCIQVKQLVHFQESFVAFGRHPFHSLRYYYRVVGTGSEHLQPDLEEVSSVQWVSPADIARDECAPGDWELITAALTALPKEHPSGNSFDSILP
jgi:8-oxo-dGTP pyrophosphatase MutT (NUDIX family)